MIMRKTPGNINFRIKEQSWLASLAAWKLGARSVAIVFGNTIHLCNTSRTEFLMNESWLKHELCHIRQYRQYGLLNFLLRYLWESLKKGYYQNKYEAEARAAENECNSGFACLLN
jgi:hypothetical protein